MDVPDELKKEIEQVQVLIIKAKHQAAQYPNSIEDVFTSILGGCFIILKQDSPSKLQALADLLLALIDGDREIWISSKPPDDIESNYRLN